MSHKSEIKTELTNRTYLKKALEKLGFKYQEAKPGEKLRTQGRYGVHEQVDILVENNDKSVGFKQNKDGTFTAVGDFYGMTDTNGKHISMQDFKGVVTGYSKDAEINDQLSNMGFSLNPEDHKVEGGKIKVQYRRWV